MSLLESREWSNTKRSIIITIVDVNSLRLYLMDMEGHHHHYWKSHLWRRCAHWFYRAAGACVSVSDFRPYGVHEARDHAGSLIACSVYGLSGVLLDEMTCMAGWD